MNIDKILWGYIILISGITILSISVGAYIFQGKGIYYGKWIPCHDNVGVGFLPRKMGVPVPISCFPDDYFTDKDKRIVDCSKYITKECNNGIIIGTKGDYDGIYIE